eukprot:TRINITY_DN10905_c0_g1_i1.p1 TRINITY_DN10905_c0_g1~~TRINITY_DN10905_c0_g1_i1.p1  ORF type:complete len:881 (+),score=171.55 TRINITY_DN10905_c0_g1_i1:217-2859(+)
MSSPGDSRRVSANSSNSLSGGGGAERSGRGSSKMHNDQRGTRDQPQPESLLQRFQRDEMYNQFLGTNFDSGKFTSSVVAKGHVGITEAAAKIERGIAVMDEELNSQVVQHHDTLLEQVRNVKDLEIILSVATEGVDHVMSSISTIKSNLSEPCSIIQTRTLQLERLQNASELLRKVRRFLSVSSKLTRVLSVGNRELPKAALCVYELETIRKEADLSGVEVVDREVQWIVRTEHEVTSRAQRLLVQGLEIQNQAEVANALQVFYNLKVLKPRVQATMEEVTRKVSSSIRNVLSVAALSEGINHQRSHSSPPAEWRAALWTRMERLTDTLHSCSVQVWHLQRVLSKMRDPSTHQCLLNTVVLPGEPSITLLYWKTLTQILETQLGAVAKGATFVEDTFVSEYPKLLRVFLEFLRRLHTHFELKQVTMSPSNADNDSQLVVGGGSGGGGVGNTESTAVMLLRCIKPFETAFLGRSLSRLFAPVEQMFPSGIARAPSSDEVQSLLKLIGGEIEGSMNDNQLCTLVARGVAKALQLFAVRCEGQVSTDQSSIQVTETTCGADQMRNAALFNALYELYTGADEICTSIQQQSVQAQDAIAVAVRTISSLAGEILAPLFRQAVAMFDRTLSLIHREDFSTEEDYDSEPDSAFMRSLRVQIHNFRNVIVSPFTQCPPVFGKTRALGSRVLISFVQQASMVRPLSDAGKMKLAGLMAQLEKALAPLHAAKDLGQPYRCVRALRTLLFRELDAISTSPECDALPPAVVLHHLFSRGPAELRLPHVRLRWTTLQYCSWVDNNTVSDLWDRMIKPSLDEYALVVNERGEKSFADVYPILQSLGGKFVDAENGGGALANGSGPSASVSSTSSTPAAVATAPTAAVTANGTLD